MICNRYASVSQLAVILALSAAAACSVNLDGQIHCVDNSNCTREYPFCVGAVSGTPGFCQATDPGDAGSPEGSVTIIGIVGHQATDIVSGTVRIEVAATAPSGVAKVQLTAGGTTFDVTASSPPIFYFDVITVGTADEILTAQLFPGDGTTAITSDPFTLHVNSLVPVLTVDDPIPASAHGGSLVSIKVTSSVALNALGGTVALHTDPTTVIGQLSITSGQLGVATVYELGFVVPVNAASGAYDITITGADSAGVSAVPVTKSLTVVGPFSITTLAITTMGGVLETLGGRTLPAAAPSTPITVVATVPATVPLTGGTVVFTLTDNDGSTRTLLGPQTVAGGGSAPQTITVSETLMPSDASGIATVTATITDDAGNIGESTQSFIIDGLAPFVTGLTPNFSSADKLTACSNGACVGNNGATITFTGQASEPVSTATFTSGGKGTATGSCQCDGAACGPGGATSPVITCTVPVPTITTSGPDTITVSLTDAVGNTSSSSLASNSSSFLAVAPPAITSFTANLTSVPGGSPVVLTSNFPAGNSGFISNNNNGSTVPVAPGTVMTSITPTAVTTYTLNVSNAVGTTITSSPVTVSVIASGFNGALSFQEPIITGGRAPSAGVVINIPSFTGASSALLLDANGNTATLSNGNPVTSSALLALAATGGPLTLAAPTTTTSTSSQFSYTLITLTPGNPPQTFTTSAVLSVVPVPTAVLTANITAVTTNNQVQLTVKTTGAACTVAGNCAITDDKDGLSIPVTGDTNLATNPNGITVTATVDQSKKYTVTVKNSATNAATATSSVSVTAVPAPTGTLIAVFNPVTIGNHAQLTLTTLNAACTVVGNCTITSSADPSHPIAVTGNTNAGLTITIPTAITATTTFTAMVKNSAQDATSVSLPPVTITTRPAPTVSLNALKTTVAIGNTINFTLALTGADCASPGECTITDQDSNVINFTGSTATVAAVKNSTFTAHVKASTNDDTSVNSAPLIITVVNSFAVTGYPNPATAGAGGNIMVTAKDTNGNTATGYTGTVAFTTNDTKSTTSVPANFTFTSANAGISPTITGANLTTATTGATIIATDTTSMGATGMQTGITVNPAAAAKLVFTTQPTNGTAAMALSAVVVTLEDMFSNVVPTDNVAVTLALATNPSGGTLSNATANTTAGVATFNNLKINKAGVGYSLSASATNPAVSSGSTNSNLFNIAIGGPATLVFVTQPAAGTTVGSGAALGSMTVAIEDSGGNVLTGSTASISLTASGGVTLSGTTSVNAVAGVATFTNVLVSGTNNTMFTITASGASVTGTSNSFTVVTGAAHVLVFTAPAANATVPAGGSFSTPVQVTVEDSGGNTVSSSAVITLTTPTSGVTLANTSATASGGVATFSALTVSGTSGTSFTLTATGASQTGTSPSYSIAVGQATQLVFTSQPSVGASIGAGSSLNVTVTAEDMGGNTVTTFSTPIVFTSSTATLTGTTSFTPSSGAITTGSALIVSGTAGNNFSVTATAGGLSANSRNFSFVVGSAFQIAITAQPAANASVGAGGNLSPALAVSIEDRGGNVVTGSSANVSLAVTAPANGVTLGGTTSMNAGSGVATFSALTILGTNNTPFSITATSGSFATVQSNNFNVVTGQAKTLSFSTQPPTTAASTTAFGVVVQLKDISGNSLTSSSASVALALTTANGATLSGTTTQTATSGAATFSGLSIDKVGSYTLTATSGTLPTAQSSGITVTAGNATQLAFATPPGLEADDGTLYPVTVQFEDAGGNATHLGIPSDAKVALTLSTGPGTLTGGTAVAVDGTGLASFMISINALSTGMGDKLTATASSVSMPAGVPGPVISGFFTVNATGTRSPHHLSFSSGLELSPNVMLHGASEQVAMALPMLAGGGAASSVTLSMSGEGNGAAARIPGPVALSSSDLGTTVKVASPQTAGLKGSASFTYVVAASSGGSSTSVSGEPLRSFPGQVDLAAARVGSTATFIPGSATKSGQDMVLIAGGASSFSEDGQCGGTIQTSAEIYEPATGFTRPLSGSRSAMSAGRCKHTALFTNGKVYLFGGSAEDSKLVEVFDPSTESFSTAASLQLGGRIGATATLVDKSILGAQNDKVIIAGGTSASGLASTSIELFDPATGRSTVYGGPRSHFEIARAEHTATLLGSFLYFIGGETTDGSIEVLDLRKPVLAGGQLSPIAAPENALARYGHSAIAVSSTEILVAGGLDAKHAYTPAVAGSMQLFTVDGGKLVSVSASAPLAQMRARAALVEAGPLGQYLLIQGSEATSRFSREDRSVSTVETITVGSGAPSSHLLTTSLASGRISPAVTNLQVPGASNFVFFIPGAASASAGAELLIGP